MGNVLMRTDKLEKAKEVISEFIGLADCGIFNTRNLAGDRMCVIYDDGELRVEVCYYWSYYEVFGLTSEEFCELRKFYNKLVG